MYCPRIPDFICLNLCFFRFQARSSKEASRFARGLLMIKLAIKVHLDYVQFYASSDKVSLLPLVVRLNSVQIASKLLDIFEILCKSQV